MQKVGQIEMNHELVKHVVEEISEQLRKTYVFPEAAEEMVTMLENRLHSGEYDKYEDGQGFSSALTYDLQKVSKDKHIKVTFHPEEDPAEGRKSEEELYKEYSRKAKMDNYGFHKVERLPGNIGYIDLRGFEDPKLGGETASSAMNFLANTEAVIFDLRKNGGGHPGMVALVTSYLLEEPTHLNSLYIRFKDSTMQSWTLPYVPGKLYPDKPVYVLTSNYTFSAAEEFTYNLKNLQRAKIIGEVTGGGAHPGRVQQITKNFRVFIPSGRAINPITDSNWEGTGVIPDVQVVKEEAFAVAYKEALMLVKSRFQHDKGYTFLVKEIEEELSKL